MATAPDATNSLDARNVNFEDLCNPLILILFASQYFLTVLPPKSRVTAGAPGQSLTTASRGSVPVRQREGGLCVRNGL
jgi:hypothetical protein